MSRTYSVRFVELELEVELDFESLVLLMMNYCVEVSEEEMLSEVVANVPDILQVDFVVLQHFDLILIMGLQIYQLLL